MEILEHGDLQYREFKCTHCGCRFVAHMREYTKAYSGRVEYYYVECPDCDGVVAQSVIDTQTYHFNKY